jgi:hypothetical protein
VGSEYGTGSIGLVWGDNLGLGWIVFTGGVLALEYSGHWPRRSWWFVGKKVIFAHVYVQDK